MFILKIYYHLLSLLKKIFFYFLYFNKLFIGKKTTWRSGFKVMISMNGKLSIGESCFFNNYCSINVNNNITIGNYNLFGENVKIYDHNHRFNKKFLTLKNQGFSNGSVKIGNNCWICSNVTILKDTKIGNNCVIGAGCVVDKTIPDNTIVKNNNSVIFEKIKFK